jgi:hypothetical protein
MPRFYTCRSCGYENPSLWEKVADGLIAAGFTIPGIEENVTDLGGCLGCGVELQVSRDRETIDVYRKYQPQQYVDMMNDYNIKRKELRIQLMNKKITWRQFSDGLEDLIIRNRAKESDYRDKKEVEPKLS